MQVNTQQLLICSGDKVNDNMFWPKYLFFMSMQNYLIFYTFVTFIIGYTYTHLYVWETKTRQIV
jgi:hypothetical protein